MAGKDRNERRRRALFAVSSFISANPLVSSAIAHLSAFLCSPHLSSEAKPQSKSIRANFEQQSGHHVGHWPTCYSEGTSPTNLLFSSWRLFVRRFRISVQTAFPEREDATRWHMITQGYKTVCRSLRTQLTAVLDRSAGAITPATVLHIGNWRISILWQRGTGRYERWQKISEL